jgi:hypothetical protein
VKELLIADLRVDAQIMLIRFAHEAPHLIDGQSGQPLLSGTLHEHGEDNRFAVTRANKVNPEGLAHGRFPLRLPETWRSIREGV